MEVQFYHNYTGNPKFIITSWIFFSYCYQYNVCINIPRQKQTSQYKDSSFLDMTPCQLSRTLVSIYQLTQYHILEDMSLHQHHCENQKSHNSVKMSLISLTYCYFFKCYLWTQLSLLPKKILLKMTDKKQIMPWSDFLILAQHLKWFTFYTHAIYWYIFNQISISIILMKNWG